MYLSFIGLYTNALRVRVVRRLTADEMSSRIMGFGRKYIAGYRDLQYKCSDGKATSDELVDYLGWSALLDAYGNYLENGELNYLEEEYHDSNRGDFSDVLTLKRLELLSLINSSWAQSINELARKSGRNVKNVYEDLKLLETLKLIRLVRVGKGKVTPQGFVEEIHLLMR